MPPKTKCYTKPRKDGTKYTTCIGFQKGTTKTKAKPLEKPPPKKFKVKKKPATEPKPAPKKKYNFVKKADKAKTQTEPKKKIKLRVVKKLDKVENPEGKKTSVPVSQLEKFGLTKEQANKLSPLELFGKLPVLARTKILDPKTTGLKQINYNQWETQTRKAVEEFIDARVEYDQIIYPRKSRFVVEEYFINKLFDDYVFKKGARWRKAKGYVAGYMTKDRASKMAISNRGSGGLNLLIGKLATMLGIKKERKQAERNIFKDQGKEEKAMMKAFFELMKYRPDLEKARNIVKQEKEEKSAKRKQKGADSKEEIKTNYKIGEIVEHGSSVDRDGTLGSKGEEWEIVAFNDKSVRLKFDGGNGYNPNKIPKGKFKSVAYSNFEKFVSVRTYASQD
jgi:hypothetical protein